MTSENPTNQEAKNPSSSRKHPDWIKIGGNVGGALGIPAILLLQIWRHGAIAVIVFSFVCVGIGAAAGAGIQSLMERKK